MRRFTTNAIYTVWYNWVRMHKTLRVATAMAAKLTDWTWDFAELVELMDRVNAPEPR